MLSGVVHSRQSLLQSTRTGFQIFAQAALADVNCTSSVNARCTKAMKGPAGSVYETHLCYRCTTCSGCAYNHVICHDLQQMTVFAQKLAHVSRASDLSASPRKHF